MFIICAVSRLEVPRTPPGRLVYTQALSCLVLKVSSQSCVLLELNGVPPCLSSMHDVNSFLFVACVLLSLGWRRRANYFVHLPARQGNAMASIRSTRCSSVVAIAAPDTISPGIANVGGHQLFVKTSYEQRRQTFVQARAPGDRQNDPRAPVVHCACKKASLHWWLQASGIAQ